MTKEHGKTISKYNARNILGDYLIDAFFDENDSQSEDHMIEILYHFLPSNSIPKDEFVEMQARIFSHFARELGRPAKIDYLTWRGREEGQTTVLHKSKTEEEPAQPETELVPKPAAPIAPAGNDTTKAGSDDTTAAERKILADALTIVNENYYNPGERMGKRTAKNIIKVLQNKGLKPGMNQSEIEEIANSVQLRRPKVGETANKTVIREAPRPITKKPDYAGGQPAETAPAQPTAPKPAVESPKPAIPLEKSVAGTPLTPVEETPLGWLDTNPVKPAEKPASEGLDLNLEDELDKAFEGTELDTNATQVPERVPTEPKPEPTPVDGATVATGKDVSGMADLLRKGDGHDDPVEPEVKPETTAEPEPTTKPILRLDMSEGAEEPAEEPEAERPVEPVPSAEEPEVNYVEFDPIVREKIREFAPEMAGNEEAIDFLTRKLMERENVPEPRVIEKGKIASTLGVYLTTSGKEWLEEFESQKPPEQTLESEVSLGDQETVQRVASEELAEEEVEEDLPIEDAPRPVTKEPAPVETVPAEETPAYEQAPEGKPEGSILAKEWSAGEEPQAPEERTDSGLMAKILQEGEGKKDPVEPKAEPAQPKEARSLDLYIIDVGMLDAQIPTVSSARELEDLRAQYDLLAEDAAGRLSPADRETFEAELNKNGEAFRTKEAEIQALEPDTSEEKTNLVHLPEVPGEEIEAPLVPLPQTPGPEEEPVYFTKEMIDRLAQYGIKGLSETSTPEEFVAAAEGKLESFVKALTAAQKGEGNEAITAENRALNLLEECRKIYGAQKGTATPDENQRYIDIEAQIRALAQKIDPDGSKGTEADYEERLRGIANAKGEERQVQKELTKLKRENEEHKRSLDHLAHLDEEMGSSVAEFIAKNPHIEQIQRASNYDELIMGMEEHYQSFERFDPAELEAMITAYPGMEHIKESKSYADFFRGIKTFLENADLKDAETLKAFKEKHPGIFQANPGVEDLEEVLKVIQDFVEDPEKEFGMDMINEVATLKAEKEKLEKELETTGKEREEYKKKSDAEDKRRMTRVSYKEERFVSAEYFLAEHGPRFVIKTEIPGISEDEKAEPEGLQRLDIAYLNKLFKGKEPILYSPLKVGATMDEKDILAKLEVIAAKDKTPMESTALYFASDEDRERLAEIEKDQKDLEDSLADPDSEEIELPPGPAPGPSDTAEPERVLMPLVVADPAKIKKKTSTLSYIRQAITIPITFAFLAAGAAGISYLISPDWTKSTGRQAQEEVLSIYGKGRIGYNMIQARYFPGEAPGEKSAEEQRKLDETIKGIWHPNPVPTQKEIKPAESIDSTVKDAEKPKAPAKPKEYVDPAMLGYTPEEKAEDEAVMKKAYAALEALDKALVPAKKD